MNRRENYPQTHENSTCRSFREALAPVGWS